MSADCRRRGVLFDRDAGEAVRPMAEFSLDIRTRARAGRDVAAREVLERAARLSFQPPDLLVGMIQPLLHELGELWARGAVAVAAEHRFSAAIDTLLALALDRRPAPRPAPATAAPCSPTPGWPSGWCAIPPT